MTFCFPGETGKKVQIVSRVCFLNSLNAVNLRIKVLELQNVSIDEALNHVCRLKNYGSLLSEGAENNSAPEARRRLRTVKTEKPVSFAPTTEVKGGSAMEQKN